ncbi:MAG: glucosylceramidase [Mucilaginibacter polytrichastri]|nr:glucosylceramidase [Mucilaginibacter polytrichastri]
MGIKTLVFALLAVASCSGEPVSNNTPAQPGTEPPAPETPVATDVEFWLTKADKSVLLTKQNVALNFGAAAEGVPAIAVDEKQTFQTMDGFGYTLTGGSAFHLQKMGTTEQAALLKELFSTENGIGISYIRVSVGASDLNATVFTYDDLPAGQSDPNLEKFSLDKDMDAVIPILKKIVAINPSIKILASPWSAPAWMKDNGSLKGGALKPEHYGTYAKYLVKYIQAMKAEGITIDALTPQNEPLHGGNNPSMVMQATEQAVFTGKNLGPELERAGLKTKIIVYDHNADKPEYPMTILADAAAAKYTDGSAFHLYAGEIGALSTVHNAYPQKNIYFTEQWTGGPGNFAEDLKWHVAMLEVGAVRNWSKNVLEWNLAADQNYQPHTPEGGCTTCLGALTIEGSAVTRNSPYYSIAHSSKFVPPGSVRIASGLISNIANVAYKTPAGKKVLVAVNTGNERQEFQISFDGKAVKTALDKGAVATYVW